jgi:predicted Zn finger-like uncharacterized protein
MKITCQACQAKYTIADEKVVGKVVKIRCKKCGASIVVNGSETSASQSPPATGAIDAAPGSPQAPWTVNVADGDQRTMTETEIVSGYRTGVVSDETFCWKEGMADWLPLLEIAPLHAACTLAGSTAGSAREEENLPKKPQSPRAEPPARAPSRPAPKEGNGTLAGPPPAATVAARRTGGRAGAADLFSGAARAGGEDEVLTSAPADVQQAYADGQKATGARNENNVHFGLKEKGGGASPPSMTATSEASGLIDIRQLSAQMRSTSGDEKKTASRVDDIMNLGVGGAFSPSLAAPVLSAPSLEEYSQPPPSMLGANAGAGAAQAKNKAMVFLALGAGTFFLVAAIGIAVMLVRGKGPLAADDRERMPATATVSETPHPPGASVAMNAPPSAAVTNESPQASAAPSAAPSEGASAAKESPTKETAQTTSPREPKEPKAGAPGPSKEPAAGVPVAEFNMGEARARLASISGGVQTCKRGDTTGGGKVEIVFAPSGAVQSANLMSGSPFDGTPTGKCVEARFRGAHVPPFGGSPFTVTKSFSIN